MRKHKKVDCWLLESNYHKRSRGLVRPNRDEVGGASVEYVLLTGDGEEERNNMFYHQGIPQHDQQY